MVGPYASRCMASLMRQPNFLFYNYYNNKNSMHIICLGFGLLLSVEHLDTYTLYEGIFCFFCWLKEGASSWTWTLKLEIFLCILYPVMIMVVYNHSNDWLNYSFQFSPEWWHTTVNQFGISMKPTLRLEIFWLSHTQTGGVEKYCSSAVN